MGSEVLRGIDFRTPRDERHALDDGRTAGLGLQQGVRSGVGFVERGQGSAVSNRVEGPRSTREWSALRGSLVGLDGASAAGSADCYRNGRGTATLAAPARCRAIPD